MALVGGDRTSWAGGNRRSDAWALSGEGWGAGFQVNNGGGVGENLGLLLGAWVGLGV